MRKALLLALVVPLVAVSATAAHAAVDSDGTFSATSLNNPTATTLLAGESAIVTATVSSDYCMWSGCTPGAASNGDSYASSQNPAMGGVTMGGGQVFVYGLDSTPQALPNGTPVTVYGPGTVSLGINDCSGSCLSDNHGAVTYTVTIVQPEAEKKQNHGQYVSGATKDGVKGKALAEIAKDNSLVGQYPPE